MVSKIISSFMGYVRKQNIESDDETIKSIICNYNEDTREDRMDNQRLKVPWK